MVSQASTMAPDADRVLGSRRRAGVSLPVSSLPGRYGIGEIGRRARDFVAALRRMECRVWQFLPLGPTAYGDSPYQPLSSFAGNENLIDIETLIADGFLRADDASELTTLPEEYVDYGALIPRKQRLLELAAQRFAARADARTRAAFAAFVNGNDARWLHDYALFRILKRRHGERPWPAWQPEYAHRDRQALADIERRSRDEIRAIKIVQFWFHAQWRVLKAHANACGVDLFGDMPIYIALDSADAWAHRELLRLDEDGRPDSVAGVPPDYFSQDGQLWGNPLYRWPQHAATDFAWWIDRLRASAELADLVRIDHFRGFEAYWAVPAAAATARGGRWEPGPKDPIFHAMRAALGRLPIVAEDLGLITPEVESLRERHRIPGMLVLQFNAADPAFGLDDVRENVVCYTGTHDNDTTLGWFHGSPHDQRREHEIRATQAAALALTGGGPETIHLDLIRAAFSTRALLAIAPLQDFLGLGSQARINTPGRSADNWRWRLVVAQLSADFCHNVAAQVRASDRAI